MSFLPHNYAIEQDVAGDLEIFVQLANVGHIGRAIRSFDNYLTVHQESFPVAAEHAEALMDQGDFRNADDFLSHVSVDISPSSKEREALDLMHALVRMHTRMECAEALKLAKATLLIRETHSLASLDVLDVGTLQMGTISAPGLTVVDANRDSGFSYRRRKHKNAIESVRDGSIPGSSRFDLKAHGRIAGRFRIHNRDVM
jgi:hypothetical protein